MKTIYLDFCATTPVDPLVAEEMGLYFSSQFGNPSSTHSRGREAREAVEKARQEIASFLNARPEEIVFVSGGTEADNLAVKGIAYANRQRGNHIITSQAEHPAVLNSCKALEKEGFEVTYLPVNQYGQVMPEDVEKALRKTTLLISLIHANNEIGTINPLKEIGEIAEMHGVYFHTDAVQSFGKLPLNVEEFSLSLLSLSGHKIYGPKGIGALYVRSGTPLKPLLHGGEQEHGRRAGTLNVPAIVGLGKATRLVRERMAVDMEKIKALRDYFESEIKKRIDTIEVNGHPSQRIANVLNVSFLGCENEALLLHLDMHGIAVSTGSACHSGTVEPSHVLKAMGLNKTRARSAIRFCLGRETTRSDIDYTLEVLEEGVSRLRKLSGR